MPRRTRSALREKTALAPSEAPPRAILATIDALRGKTAAAPPHALPRASLATIDELTHPELTYLVDPSFFIRSGYRWRSNACANARSLCELHNETANVWTHLGAAFVFLATLITLLIGGPRAISGLELSAGATAPPSWPLGVFLVGASACLGMSATYHLFEPLGRTKARFLQRLDYAGISILIFTSVVAPIFYVFFCDQPTALLYGLLAALTNGTAIVLGLRDEFATEPWRRARAACYVLSGVLGAVPVIHAIHGAYSNDDKETLGMLMRLLRGLLLMGAQYVLGAILYALRVPERFYPGRLDYFASHSIFHVLVVTAAMTHWVTIQSLYLWRAHEPACGLVSSAW
jgi:adiponectin receptor